MPEVDPSEASWVDPLALREEFQNSAGEGKEHRIIGPEGTSEVL